MGAGVGPLGPYLCCPVVVWLAPCLFGWRFSSNPAQPFPCGLPATGAALRISATHLHTVHQPGALLTAERRPTQGVALLAPRAALTRDTDAIGTPVLYDLVSWVVLTFTLVVADVLHSLPTGN